jgi:hypothetical protein
VDGFLQLRERGTVALDEFYAAAAALVQNQLDMWRERWATGALTAAMRTGDQIGELERGDHRHLRDGRLSALDPPRSSEYGLCGRLTSFDLAPTLVNASSRVRDRGTA